VSGTGSNAVFWIQPDNMNWISGEDHIKIYSMPDGWQSVFCKDCGSPLPRLIPDQMWIIPAGLMDEDPEVGVRGHIWVENKPHWEIIGDNAPQFTQTP